MNNKLSFFCMALFFAPAALYAQGIKIMPGTTFALTGGAYNIVLANGAHFENDAAVQSPDLILKASGNNNSEVKGSAGLSIGQLLVNKNAGQSILLQKDISITNRVVFTTGLLDLNQHDVLLADTAFLQNESETSRTIGALGGTIQVHQNLNAPLAENPGNLGLVITSGADWGNTLIKRGHEAYSNGGGNSISRSFEVIPTNDTNLSTFLRMYYLDAELNGLDENLTSFFRSDDNGLSWDDIGVASRNTAQNFININGVNSMSLFTLSTINNPLPVQLSALSSSCTQGRPGLQWQVANPQDIRFFKIEKSKDGAIWERLPENIPVVSSAVHTYRFTDVAEPYPYYRLLCVELSGAPVLSPVEHVDCKQAGGMFSLLENPVQEMIRIGTRSAINADIVVTVYDMQGRKLITKPLVLSSGNAQLLIDVSALAAGMYQLNLMTKDELLWQAKFVK